MTTNRRSASSTALILTCLLLGALLDFIFNGVLKIVWFIVYGPVYLACAEILLTKLMTSHPPRLSRLGAGALLCGAFAAHLGMTGLHRQEVYRMSPVSTDPITFRSDDWPQKLYVSSDGLAKKLLGVKTTEPVPVIVSRVVDYGCTRSFTVVSVDDVDVRDPGSRWSWKSDPGVATPTHPIGPGYEDDGLSWCKISFYPGRH